MTTAVAERTYSTVEVAELAGVSYRRIDYWARTGALPDRAAGQGSLRSFTSDEVILAAMIAEAQSHSLDSLKAFRANHEDALAMIQAGVDFVAVIEHRFWDVAEVEAFAKAWTGSAGSWLVLDLRTIRARVDARA